MELCRPPADNDHDWAEILIAAAGILAPGWHQAAAILFECRLRVFREIFRVGIEGLQEGLDLDAHLIVT